MRFCVAPRRLVDGSPSCRPGRARCAARAARARVARRRRDGCHPRSEVVRADHQAIVHRVLLVERARRRRRARACTVIQTSGESVSQTSAVWRTSSSATARAASHEGAPQSFTRCQASASTCVLEVGFAHLDHLGDRAARARADREEGRLAMARRIAARGGVEVADRVAAASPPHSPSLAAPQPRKTWSSESSRRTARRSLGIAGAEMRGVPLSYSPSQHPRPMPARRIAIVTGGNRGIGHEIARQLAEGRPLRGDRRARRRPSATQRRRRPARPRARNVAGLPARRERHQERAALRRAGREAPRRALDPGEQRRRVSRGHRRARSSTRPPRSGARPSRPTSSARCACAARWCRS